MRLQDIEQTKNEFVAAAKNAMEAGFDGVELHGANGYLLEEFLSPFTNTRKDNYGGSISNRCRFVVEVVTAVAAAIGKEHTGVRLSPYGVANDMELYPEVDDTHELLSKEFNNLGIAYIHLVDHSAMGAPGVPPSIKKLVRHIFKNKIILCGGYDKKRAEADIENGRADLIAFGRPFINNPDLVERLANDWPLAQDLKTELFYSANEKGYTDYPVYQRRQVLAL
jgi:N-ethylmaleimide reductase